MLPQRTKCWESRYCTTPRVPTTAASKMKKKEVRGEVGKNVDFSQHRSLGGGRRSAEDNCDFDF